MTFAECDYAALKDKEFLAMTKLDDAGLTITPEDLARLIPDLPPDHPSTRAAQGMLDGLTLDRPTDWCDLMQDEWYALGFWSGWTRACDRAFQRPRRRRTA